MCGIVQADTRFETLIKRPHRIWMSKIAIRNGVCTRLPVLVQESQRRLKLRVVEVITNKTHGQQPTAGIRVIARFRAGLETHRSRCVLDMSEPDFQPALEKVWCNSA